MPLSCSTSALTGASGMVTFKPAGGKACLLDYSDFPAGSDIEVPASVDYRPGDQISFTPAGTAKLDTALTAGTAYVVVTNTGGKLRVAAAAGGAAITLKGDGGLGAPAGGAPATLGTGTLPTTSGSYTGSAGPFTGVATTGGTGTGLTVDVTLTTNNVTAIVIAAAGTGYTAGDTITIDGGLIGGTTTTDNVTFTVATASAVTTGGNTAGGVNHIEVGFAEYQAVCSVTEWDLSLTKEQADVTTLPCSVGTGGSKVAPVRKQIGTFLSGEGSMSILFTSDHASMGQRLLANSVMVDSRVDAKLYIDAVSGGAAINDAASSYFEGPVNLLGFEISVNTSDALVATVNFSLADQPKALFGVKL